MIKQFMVELGDKNVDAIKTLQYKHQFKYRTLLGDIIFYYILCWLDIITALIFLYYFGYCPANIHFI